MPIFEPSEKPIAVDQSSKKLFVMPKQLAAGPVVTSSNTASVFAEITVIWLATSVFPPPPEKYCELDEREHVEGTAPGERKKRGDLTTHLLEGEKKSEEAEKQRKNILVDDVENIDKHDLLIEPEEPEVIHNFTYDTSGKLSNFIDALEY
ncbi:Protein CBG27664 [Caenorhabditis briggsae]|uniref:Protein CBG27664 n=1 Tax=Caenorhabditis briggsae TaxID=6238 RepID=B6IJA9_CAEBR|nr:Protein CBG27664 [Caenorhabditis briggsae]CAR99943.1 Protein CBG27664 [Caenorhabditis briggsae]